MPATIFSRLILGIAVVTVTACTGQSMPQSDHPSSEENVVEPVATEGREEARQIPENFTKPQSAESIVNNMRYHEPKSFQGDLQGKSVTVLDDRKERDDENIASLKEDSAVLVFESIVRQDCIVRGLIRNLSDHLYARNVSITLAQRDGGERSVWHWPLTMEPGESAPFEMHINWFPDLVLDHAPWSDNLLLELWGNLDRNITADFSTVPDIRREIIFNADQTEYEILYDDDYDLIIVDERAFELEEYLVWRNAGRRYHTSTKEGLSFVYPDELVLSMDFRPVSESLVMYKYVDLYYGLRDYVPHREYPDMMKSINDLGVPPKIENVRVFQAIMDGANVLDVWELVPHSISEQVDKEGRLLVRNFAPTDILEEYGEGNYDRTFIRYLTPLSHLPEFPQRNWDGEDGKHVNEGRVLTTQLWLGGVSHELVPPLQDTVGNLSDSNRVSCTAEGRFTKDSWRFVGQEPQLFTYPLGSYGVYKGFEPGAPSEEKVVVEWSSLLVTDGSIRGLIKNSSSSHIARDVSVELKSVNGEFAEDVWHWPLSIQPGERVPFELIVGNTVSAIEDLEFYIEAEFSNFVDLTRAFIFYPYLYGRIYDSKYENTYVLGQYDGVRRGSYLDQYALWEAPSYRYLKHDFVNSYEGAVVEDELTDAELYSFVDFYVRLVVPHSHPDLENAIRNQHIHKLRAFAAILNDDRKVVSVKELVPFTPVYAPANVDSLFTTVSSIPAPNRWSPDAVRLLLTIPYVDDADMADGRSYQLWIGGE